MSSSICTSFTISSFLSIFGTRLPTASSTGIETSCSRSISTASSDQSIGQTSARQRIDKKASLRPFFSPLFLFTPTRPISPAVAAILTPPTFSSTAIVFDLHSSTDVSPSYTPASTELEHALFQHESHSIVQQGFSPDGAEVNAAFSRLLEKVDRHLRRDEQVGEYAQLHIRGAFLLAEALGSSILPHVEGEFDFALDIEDCDSSSSYSNNVDVDSIYTQEPLDLTAASSLDPSPASTSSDSFDSSSSLSLHSLDAFSVLSTTSSCTSAPSSASSVDSALLIPKQGENRSCRFFRSPFRICASCCSRIVLGNQPSLTPLAFVRILAMRKEKGLPVARSSLHESSRGQGGES